MPLLVLLMLTASYPYSPISHLLPPDSIKDVSLAVNKVHTSPAAEENV